ncbi:MAG: DUF2914 domain-containing protein [Candidatus Krumholzibacteria bacterium]|nr:DUF2914 domain-containing protein [Candidatus Krumholzibacteria bacterium]
MAETNVKRTGGMLAGVVVLTVVCAFAGWLPAVAQEGNPSPAQESQSVEPAQRVGVWVDVLFGTDIDKETRAVIGEGSTFPFDGDRVYCLTRIHGMSPPTSVTHVWYYEGKTMARVELSVGSENWRTWSFKTYKPEWTGFWEVKILDGDGMVLGSAGFEVK